MISLRLHSILNHLPICDSYLDVGCDHGYLAMMIKQQHPDAKVGASDVAKGPLEAAKRTFDANHIYDIPLYLSDGLIQIPDAYRCVILAGMGGMLVISILEARKEYLEQVEYLVIQANRDVPEVRKWLMEHDYTLTDEQMILDYKYYTILIAKKGKCSYDEKQLLFGPYLMQSMDDTFKNYWLDRYQKNCEILKGLSDKQSRYTTLQHENERIDQQLHQ